MGQRISETILSILGQSDSVLVAGLHFDCRANVKCRSYYTAQHRGKVFGQVGNLHSNKVVRKNPGLNKDREHASQPIASELVVKLVTATYFMTGKDCS